MSVTRGGQAKGKHFNWHFDDDSNQVLIKNENGKEHAYSVKEIQTVLRAVYREFKSDYFPLANNVERLSNGTEKIGLGKLILELEESNIHHAQGSSYLGVVLEECEYFVWNGQHMGIEWRLEDTNFSLEKITSQLKQKAPTDEA